MSIKSLLNQDATLYVKSGYSRYGREQVTADATYKARVQRTSKARLLPNGEQVNILAIAYLAGSVAINNDDRVTYDSEEYKVFGINTVIDGRGNTHHTKVELIKWQET